MKIGKGSAALTGCRSRHIQSNPVLIPWHTRKSEKDRACGRRGKGGEGGEEEAKYGVEEMRWRKREKGRGGERKREGDGGTGGWEEREKRNVSFISSESSTPKTAVVAWPTV